LRRHYLLTGDRTLCVMSRRLPDDVPQPRLRLRAA
jgi:hypothetical protein